MEIACKECTGFRRPLSTTPQEEIPEEYLRALASELPHPNLRSESFLKVISAPADDNKSLHAALYLIDKRGEVLVTNPQASKLPTIAGQVFSGFMNLNLTAILVQVVAVSSVNSTLIISAIAKEGICFVNDPLKKLCSGWNVN